MRGPSGGGVWAVLLWIALPAVPVVLEDAYSGLPENFSNGVPLIATWRAAPDPHDWGWFAWLTELGPLLGFGFLAGATLALPDEPTGRRGPRAWLSRRGFWVAVGPWAGFLVWVAIVWVFSYVEPLLPNRPPAPDWSGSWVGTVFFWVAFAFVVSTLCYGWLVFAFAAVRRARRLGRAWESVRRGLAFALAFAGSLFGSFWAVTEWWRTYFFDPRIVPLVFAALTLAAVSGCSGTITYGEVRRRELFHAMLLSWTFGLALLWRWWARPRSKPPT